MLKKNKIGLLAIGMIVALALCCIPPQNYNSKCKMDIISSYGDDEAYHPKIISFQEPWNGFKYWMSYTPYPKGDDTKENPHIVASNDLVTWENVLKPDRPLDAPENFEPLKRYNSDSHIVYNAKADTLECYWRYVDDIENKAYLYRKQTKDGINWTEKEIAAHSEDRTKKDYVSPAILFENDSYKMWYVDKNNVVKYTFSQDGIHWNNEEKIVDIPYSTNLKTWHLDVIKSDIGYEMVVVAFDQWENHNDMNLYYSKSQDGITWEEAVTILKPTKGTNYWDNRGIYRSTFIKINDLYILIYGGTSSDLHHGLGMMYGKNIKHLKKVNINFQKAEEREKLVKKIKEERK